MNFRPGPLKIITSFIVFGVLNLFLASTMACVGFCGSWYLRGLHPELIAVSLMSFVLAYVIWSLFEKR